MKKAVGLELSKFANSALQAGTREVLCKHFESFLERLGFNGFMYTSIPGLPRKEPDEDMFIESVLLYCTDMKVVENLMASEMFGRGPILIKMVTGLAEPFTPYQAFKEITGKPPPGRPEEILEDPAIAYSLICPLDTPDRRHGVTLLSKERSILKLYRQFWKVKTIAYSGTVLSMNAGRHWFTKNTGSNYQPERQNA